MKKTSKIIILVLVCLVVLVSCDSRNDFGTSNQNSLEEATIYYRGIEEARLLFFNFIDSCMDAEFDDYIEVIEQSNTFDVTKLSKIKDASIAQNRLYRTPDGFLGIFLFRYQTGDYYTIKCRIKAGEIQSVELLYNGVGA